MKLSDGEKLILVMLSEIYKHHKIKGEIEPEVVLTSIFHNQLWGLKWKYDGLFNTPGETPPVVQETCDILDMYRAISAAWPKLSPADQKRVKDETGHSSDYLKYQGFDGNNDPHLNVVVYLVKTLERYTEIKHPDLNSHSIATLRHYRKMISEFKKIEDPFSAGMTADQLIAIVK